MKNDVLRNFTKFAGKHLCQSLFFNKVAGLSAFRSAELSSYSLIDWGSCEIARFYGKIVFVIFDIGANDFER